MNPRAYIAVDLGAESGRVIVGVLSRDSTSAGDPPRLELVEVHRFLHEPQKHADGLRWNVEHIWNELLTGLRAAAAHSNAAGLLVVSVGVDTWGVDFVLLDEQDRPLAQPRCYRDPRWQPGVAMVGEKIGHERLYQITGIQEMAINTLPQLATALALHETAIAKARRLLMMPDYFHFRLGGEPGNESSIASTSQMLDATTGQWSAEVLSKLGLPPTLFGPPISAGTIRGTLRPEAANATGLPPTVRIVAPGSHDTASAVAGVPAGDGSWAYLSSGTWSLLGVELHAPILTEQARRLGFTNERGVGGTIRFLKNLIGLWLLQELRRDLERAGTSIDYAHLTQAAAAARPFRTFIDSSDPSLTTPGDMIHKIQALARRAGDPQPTTPGELARCCLESLAMAYRACLEDLESLIGRRVDTIHIVGGGTKNVLLNQMTADTTGRRVLAGPAEATAAGNVLVQAMADGQAKDLAAIRRIVARSFEPTLYKPQDAPRWTTEYARYRAIAKASS